MFLAIEHCVVLAEPVRGFPKQIATTVGHFLVETGNPLLLLDPILGKLDHPLEATLFLGKLLRLVAKTTDSLFERAVRAGVETHDAHVDTGLGSRFRVNRIGHFPLRLHGYVPAVHLAADGDVLGYSFDEAASSVFHPTDARQIDLPTRFIHLEALWIADGIFVAELLVKLWEVRAPFEEVREGTHQILETLLQNLTVALGKPLRFLGGLPLRKLFAKLRIRDFEVRIRRTLITIPSQSLVVDETRTAAEPGEFAAGGPVGLELELIGFS